MSVFPANLRTRYLRAILEGGLRRPVDMQLTPEEKEDLVRKILFLVNPPHQPFIRDICHFIDSDLFKAYPWMSPKQQKVFEYVQESDTLKWSPPHWAG